MTDPTLTRRRLLKSGTAAMALGLAGCTTSPDAPQETVYVAAYHWGYALFDDDGTERDEIRVPEGTELALSAVNDHAHDALHGLPEPVATAFEELHPLERTKRHVAEGRIAAPDDGTIEEKYEATHDHDADLSDHSLMIPAFDVRLDLDHHQEEPATATFTTDQAGTYSFACGIHCGYGHAYMTQDLLIVE